MKIKDLPKDIKRLAIANQIAQGNEKNIDLEVSDGIKEGNFNWDDTREGYDFWELVCVGSIEDAYNLLDNTEQEESKSEILYTEEEVYKIASKSFDTGYAAGVNKDISHIPGINFDNWFEQIKKK